DYIFGNASAVFERDELHSNGPGFVTAQSRTSPQQNTGYVIVDSRVTASLASSAPPPADAAGAASTATAHGTVGLGSTWRPYARVIYIRTEIGAEVAPGGWNNWNNAANELTAYFAEFGSTGPGGSTATRVPWSHQLTAEQIKPYLPQMFLSGSDHWDA